MTDTHTLAVAVAVRIARGAGWCDAYRAVAELNHVTPARVEAACWHVEEATRDPQLERLGAQYLPAVV
jgi:hypothetical protein